MDRLRYLLLDMNDVNSCHVFFFDRSPCLSPNSIKELVITLSQICVWMGDLPTAVLGIRNNYSCLYLEEVIT